MLTSFEWSCLYEYHNARDNEISEKDYELLLAIGDMIAVTNIIDLEIMELANTTNEQIKIITKDIQLCETVEEVIQIGNDAKLYWQILEELKSNA